MSTEPAPELSEMSTQLPSSSSSNASQALPTRHGHGLGSSMGWVGFEIFAYEMGWIGFSCQKLIIFFTTIIIPLRKALTVIYHYSLHHELFPQGPQLPLGIAFYLLIGF